MCEKEFHTLNISTSVLQTIYLSTLFVRVLSVYFVCVEGTSVYRMLCAVWCFLRTTSSFFVVSFLAQFFVCVYSFSKRYAIRHELLHVPLYTLENVMYRTHHESYLFRIIWCLALQLSQVVMPSFSDRYSVLCICSLMFIQYFHFEWILFPLLLLLDVIGVGCFWK